MDSNKKKYKYISIEDKVIDVMNHPAFKNFGFYLFPWNDEKRYNKNMAMKDVISLNLWHTNLKAEEEVSGLNRLIDEINKGYKVFYDIYTEEEKKKDPFKNSLDSFLLEVKKMLLI